MRMRLIPVVMALAGTAGCILSTGQVMISYDLPSPVRVSGADALVAMQVNLTEIQSYRDHKSGLKNLADVALLGNIANGSSGDPVDIEVWLTRTATQLQEVTQVREQGIPIWGGQRVEAEEVRRLDWDDSAKLVYEGGRQALLDESRGDGIFTLYFIDRASIYDFTVSEGALVLVLDTDL